MAAVMVWTKGSLSHAIWEEKGVRLDCMALAKTLSPATGHCREEGEAGRCSGAGCCLLSVPIFLIHAMAPWPSTTSLLSNLLARFLT